MVKIGITERGDAGWDLSWKDKLLNNPDLKGIILITKSINRPDFLAALNETYPIKPVILHADCTGWGNTPMEPLVNHPDIVLNTVRNVIDSGFPSTNVVLRIDPIIPSTEGLEKASYVLHKSMEIIPDVSRIRISIYDDYHKAREEMIRRGYPPIDSFRKWKNEAERRPSDNQVVKVANLLRTIRPDTYYECCAEPELTAYDNHFIPTGCCSYKDLQIMNIDTSDIQNKTNGQQRFGCLCLQVKTELLEHRHRCPNNCAYCYWG